MMYHVYHIPGKKVGVTSNLEDRVTKQQGYEPGEYTVVYSTDEISVASIMERELQEAYGYKVDETLYQNLTVNTKNKSNMNINVTEQTTTFACPVNKLKGQLMDNIGMQWSTTHREFTVTEHSITWILANVHTSQFSKERCFIYNKAFAKYYDKDPHRNIILGTTFDAKNSPTISLSQQEALVDHNPNFPPHNCNQCNENIFECIREWAKNRGIYDGGDVKTQYIKLAEEFGETGKAILNNDMPEIIDGIGDMVVVLTNLAELCGVSIEECIQEAYDVISTRKGKMINGTFIKDE